VTHRRALAVVLALRTDHLDDFLFEQLGQHPGADTDAQGEQPPPSPSRPACRVSCTHGGNASSSRPTCLSDTVSTAVPPPVELTISHSPRPDKAGGPPPQVLRATGQPRGSSRSASMPFCSHYPLGSE
jgi:hypothetical protein